ncbi:hypothetical protein AB0F30_33360 [Streptomyces sp. NPDC029006]|uniref:hypothetical protein n=1 Tax=Streptomyces sp. NPDC029006 TaxID=3155467 RepID=UPI0033EE2CC0
MASDGYALGRRMVAHRAGREFLAVAAELAEAHPHPHGRSLRVTVTDADSGEDIGSVDIDSVNLWALWQHARRPEASPAAEAPAPARRLRLVRPV